jgi:tripartite-type tricarboxylate transporter receptor subunit TctC
MDRRQVLAGISASVVAGAHSGARAQSAWPNRTIKIVVPFPPGGQGDLAARPIADALQKRLGPAVIVENRAGAGGKTGNAAVARAEPDGYSLLMTLSSLAVLPEADRLFERPSLYEVDDLAPVARILADPTLLAVSADSPWKTVKEFVEDAKARPGEIPYGSSGPYGTLHVAMEMFATEAGIKLLHVPFTGAGPAVNALLQGSIKALASAPGVLRPQADAGSIRVLANWGAERVSSFPDVPTFKELGYPNVEFYIWAGLFAPRKTPPAIIDRLRTEVKAIMADPATTHIFENAGSPPAWLDAPDFNTFIEADSARLIRAVKKIGKVG